jgi:hypothetical protein
MQLLVSDHCTDNEYLSLLQQVGPYNSGTVPRSNRLAVEKLNSNVHLGVKQSVDASGKNGNVARPSSSHGLESGLKEVKLTSSLTGRLFTCFAFSNFIALFLYI